MPDGAQAGPDEDRIEAAVRAVLVSMSGDLTAKEAALLAELEALGRTIARAKAEIAQLSVDDITGAHIPSATDELDAIVDHTAQATNEILDACETLEKLEAEVPPAAAEALQGAVTRIYEACSFQDITGQRISKVVSALKAIESRVEAAVANASGRPAPAPAAAAPVAPKTEGQELANGPQLPGGGTSQEEIDRLLASFD
ncbi:protein phosphatase CheZ [Roseomonas sp. PWR1]|uniref:Protein phosphatase CheZ n=1 Tax=Roseomonas nitratireducens TaxID=2820810 RepID=A0ABS4AU15_9PROT|nr:protein phosphatase CheZ [Neoroseomonas nitratireducens]MBP0464860.1 protein phosphatase CheZ [Neoroseomonas nitratireducens]